ncbi:MAG: PSD1 and planctomycete cytochrome C domain-containing protein [Verrucomicrobiota bacterium]
MPIHPYSPQLWRPCLPLLGWLLVAASPAWSAPTAKTPPTDSQLTFEHDIRPILKTNCFQCHGEDHELKGELDLRFRKTIVKGGKSGSALIPGDRDKSPLYTFLHKREMPPEDSTPLKNSEIELIARWIDQKAPTAYPEPDQIPAAGELVITGEERAHWSFQAIKKPALPQNTSNNSSNPVDAFIAEKLTEKKLSASPQAPRITLIRRATFDLTGLPPTKAEIDDFINDSSPGAWQRVIDRLLASPQYGERWGRHWLDVAGYSDSEGYDDKDVVRPDVWRYRDYVVRAFNSDKPFDQFIVEQLAGDELAKADYTNARTLANNDADTLEKLTATAFLRLGPDGTGSAATSELQKAANQNITETLKIVSSSLLGLTVACAECHHHRFDPIPQEDFYRLRAVFAPALDTTHWRKPTSSRLPLLSKEDKIISDAIEAEAKKVSALYVKEGEAISKMIFERVISRLPEEVRAFARETYNTPEKERTPEQVKFITEKYTVVNVPKRAGGPLKNYIDIEKDRKELERRQSILLNTAAAIRKTKPQVEYIRVATENPGNIPPITRVFYRGDHTSPKTEPMAPADFTVLAQAGSAKIANNDPALKSTGRRLAYARHLTNGRHPLTARVLVNRFWLHHFGRGIVNTPGDFGLRGERPSHPELLDWLASDFMENGWSVKRLHKLLMSSSTYQQTSARRADHDNVDADNTLLWRMPVHRLEAETIRDSILATSGKLNPLPFGEPIPVAPNSDGSFVVGGGKISADGREYKRSLYVQTRRSQPVSMLEVFDAPQMEPNCELRNSSTVTPQSLALMNSDFILKQAELFAQRVIAESGPKADSGALIRHAWQLACGQPPTAAEFVELKKLLDEQKALLAAAKDKKDETFRNQQALTTLCQVLFQTNRFLYVD